MVAASLVCGGSGGTVAASTKAVPLSAAGNAEIEDTLTLPMSCMAPVVLVRAFSAALPLLTEQLESELLDEERSLVNLGTSLDEVSTALPECEQTASSLLAMSRLLMILIAGIFGLHGATLCLGSLKLNRQDAKNAKIE